MPAPTTHDFVHLEISSASVLNTSVNGPLNYLIGRDTGSDDAIEIEDSLEILSGSGGRYLRLPQGTTGQRPTGAAGLLRFNATDSAVDFHDGTNWEQVLAANLINFERLNTIGDVGDGADQLAQGSHLHVYNADRGFSTFEIDSPSSFAPLAIGQAGPVSAGGKIFVLVASGIHTGQLTTVNFRVINTADSDAVIISFGPWIPFSGAGTVAVFVGTAIVPNGAILECQYTSNRSVANESVSLGIISLS